MPVAGMTAVDRMVQGKDPAAGQRNLGFKVEDCLAAASQIADEAARKGACERLMQSSLFKPVDGSPGQWQFANQSIGDLFLARWADAGLGADKGVPCGLIPQRAAMFESNEIAGFLVGLPNGQKCLLSITQELCSRAGFAQHNYEQLDQGLPGGPGRLALIEQAMRKAEALPAPDLCVSATLDRLFKGAGGKAPAEAPADAKGKKKPNARNK
jgi:hypothetical protein